MEASPRLRWTLLAALALHAAGATLAIAVHKASSRVAFDPGASAAEVDIEPESLPAEAPRVLDEGRPTEPSSPLTRSTLSRAAPRAASRAQEAAVPALASSAERSEPWTLPTVPTEARPRVGALVGDHRDPAVNAGIAIAVAAQRDQEALHEQERALHARDLELGLLPGGELVALARDAARTSLAPVRSHAFLEIDIDDTGAVVSGRILDASSGELEWEAVARSVVSTAQESSLRLVNVKRGIAVTLEVTSAVKSVDGVTQSEKRSALDKAKAIAGAIASPLDALAGRAAPPQRVVSARVVDVRSR